MARRGVVRLSDGRKGRLFLIGRLPFTNQEGFYNVPGGARQPPSHNGEGPCGKEGLVKLPVDGREMPDGKGARAPLVAYCRL